MPRRELFHAQGAIGPVLMGQGVKRGTKRSSSETRLIVRKRSHVGWRGRAQMVGEEGRERTATTTLQNKMTSVLSLDEAAYGRLVAKVHRLSAHVVTTDPSCHNMEL